MSNRSMNTTLGHKVIAVDSAEEIGTVKSFVVSRDVAKIERIQVDGRNNKALFAEWTALESFGPDAVMVTLAQAPALSEGDRDIEVAKGDIDIIGVRVLDTAGFEHGSVVDVEFDGDDGSIHTVSTDGGATIAATNLRSLGSYALVIDAD